MNGRLTTHVIDMLNGRPAVGLALELWKYDLDNRKRLLTTAHTNAHGRTDRPLLGPDAMTPGGFELVLAIGDYFAEAQVDNGWPPFFDRVPIRFVVTDADNHYHVPVLVSPWAYTSYRGV